MIEIRHLKLVHAVAEVGTLKRAAEMLCLTQSALSHQLRELEAQLGTPVFYRVNIKNTFTAMIKGIAEEAAAEQITTPQEMQAGIRALLRTAQGGGTFNYTFFKAVATKVITLAE